MKKIILLFTTCLLADSAVAQITVNLNPSQDNSIYSESSNSNGTGALFSGYTCSGNSRRALIQFDIAGSLPAGATVTAVTLTLNVMSTGGSATAENYAIYPLATAWGEGTSFGTGTGAAPVFPDATWNDSQLGTPWGTPGGAYGASSANTVLTDVMGLYNWSSAQMVTDVQNWLNTPSSNHGWILIGDETATCTARMFGSSEQGVDPVLSITYDCNDAPTAVCQNVSATLASNGTYTLSPASLNGGSVAVCGGTLSYGASQTAFDCGDIITVPGNLVITAVYDGPLGGGLPKGVELYAINNIADLSLYGVGAANNGGGTDGEEFSFPVTSVSAGSYIYVASDAVEFQNYFGFAPDYTSGFMAINGDDAIELFENGSVIDVFGDINVDGTGQPWDYEDGWAYRNDATGPDGTAFLPGSWTYSGANALDGTTSNSTAGTPVPIGTYTAANAIPVTLTVTDQFLNMATCVASVIVFDNTPPAVSCIAPTTLSLDMTGNLTLTPADINNGTTDACGAVVLSITSQSSFTCLDLGLNTVTLSATDLYGNVSTCNADITIIQTGGMAITVDSVFHVTCNGDSDGAIYTTITGGNPPYVMDWDNDGTGDFDDLDDITGLGGGTYTLTVTDNNGCTAQVMVTIIEPAVLDATLSPMDISCFGEMDGAIDMTVTGGTIPYLFDWDNDGTGDTDDLEDLSDLAADVYEVMIIDDNGCTAIFNETIFDATPVDVSVTVTGFTLTANATGSTFQWVGCPAFGPIPGQTSATFNPSVDGDYAVIVTDGNGCEDTSVCNTISGIGVTENAMASFEIYPNPANHLLTIVSRDFSEPFVISISDTSGRIVMRNTIVSPTQVLDVSTVENGIYFITSAKDNNSAVTKFVIAR
jgi:hypothetical protein